MKSRDLNTISVIRLTRIPIIEKMIPSESASRLIEALGDMQFCGSRVEIERPVRT